VTPTLSVDAFHEIVSVVVGAVYGLVVVTPEMVTPVGTLGGVVFAVTTTLNAPDCGDTFPFASYAAIEYPKTPDINPVAPPVSVNEVPAVLASAPPFR
jgi:hypothetical protein